MMKKQQVTAATAKSARDIFLTALGDGVLGKISPHLQAHGGLARISGIDEQRVMNVVCKLSTNECFAANCAYLIGEGQQTVLCVDIGLCGDAYEGWSIEAVVMFVQQDELGYGYGFTVHLPEESFQPSDNDDGWLFYTAQLEAQKVTRRFMAQQGI